MNRNNSDSLFLRAQTWMPGGVSSPVRAFRSVGGTPVFFKHAEGSRFTDEDGNSYLDMCMSWGPLILGHSHPDVVRAVQETATHGLSYGACCRQEADLAELVLSAFPERWQIRFVSSGTEAVMTAIRLARGATGRSKILKFEGGYHGHSDSLLVKAGSGLATFGTSSSKGVPREFASQTIVCPLDDEQALEQIFTRWGPQLAAVILEPLPGNNGLLEQRPGWLRALRQHCDSSGALLILDEVISGFRSRFGGYGDRLGIAADLLTLGKIIGGGMPLGALAGPRDLMRQLAPEGPVYQAGTLSGNPVSLAAGLATLAQLQDGRAYHRLEELGQSFEAALEKAALDLPYLRWRRSGSLIWLYLDDSDPPRRADAISTVAVERFNGIHAALLDRGFYLPPSAYELMFLSTAHDEGDLADLASAIGELLRSAT